MDRPSQMEFVTDELNHYNCNITLFSEHNVKMWIVHALEPQKKKKLNAAKLTLCGFLEAF